MFVNLASSGNASSLNMALQIRHWRIITDVAFYLHTLKYISNGISLSDTLDSTCLYIVNSGVGANDELIRGGGKDLLSGGNGNDVLLSDYLVYCATDKSLSGRVPLIVVCCVSNMAVG